MAGPTDVLSVAVGALLVFFLPGFVVTRALWPERRLLRGAGAARALLETITLSLVLSVVLTVLVGYLLLEISPGGFQAFWRDPVLEAVLAGIALVAFGAGLVQGAYFRSPLTGGPVVAGDGEEGAWELGRRLERLRQRERQLERALARAPASSEGSVRLQGELEEVRAEAETVRRRREDQYAS